MSVYKKISLVMQDVTYLQKDDKVEFKTTKYKAISEEKVTTAVREALVKHGLVIIPIKQEHHKVDTLTTVDVTYKIVDVDTGDSIEAVSSGTGADTQDKGVGKAMTYAYKYLLLRTFAIPTGEDPDKVSSAELDAKQAPKTEGAITQKTTGEIKVQWLKLGLKAPALNAQIKKLYNCEITGLKEEDAQDFLSKLYEQERQKQAEKELQGTT